jgi:chromosome segregation ATPase
VSVVLQMQQRMKECEGQIEQQKSECESLLRILQDKKEKQKLEFEKEKQEMTATIAGLESEIKQLRKEAHDQKTLSREIRETGESLVLILQDQKEKQALEFEKEKQAMTATIATLPGLENELQQLKKEAQDQQNTNAQQKLEFEARLDQAGQERDASAKARDMLQQEKHELEHKLADHIKQVHLALEARDIAVALTGLVSRPQN